MELKVTKTALKNDLIKLGIKKGDLLFISIDVFKAGFFVNSKKETLSSWVEILCEIVGNEGGIILPAFTKTFFRFKKDKKIIFDRFAHTTSGALSSFLVKHEGAVRSKHPKNSCIGIGNSIAEIFKSHNHESMSYTVVGEIIKRGGKFVMIGTLDSKNAPQAIHYSQEQLGYTAKMPTKGLFQTYYRTEENKIELFTVNDIGGCSKGGHKLIGPLVVQDAIDFGYVGHARSAIMDGQKCYDVVKEELRKNRKIIQCGNKDCLDCYGNFHVDGLRSIPFYLSKMISKLTKGKK
ncbi:AAC(3) family N-acetyltransferase [Allomuricauda sp. R78024]|uniref:AAC(3) family N-acetyltransferase n=1 Tax=Allomuricauda sp. R78024 TaxID=3093867 RepID=UPI0037CC77F6